MRLLIPDHHVVLLTVLYHDTRHLARTFYLLYAPSIPTDLSIDQSSRVVTTTHSLDNGKLVADLTSPCSCTPSLLPTTLHLASTSHRYQDNVGGASIDWRVSSAP
jgi:hypothetical protein